jgi:hypothetical protein
MAPGVGLVQCVTGDVSCSGGETAAQAATIPLQIAAGLAINKAANFVAGKIAGWMAGVDADVAVSASRYPESAQHIKDAQAAGQPQVLTIDRGGAVARRAEALKGTKPQSGTDRDEYPPAMFREGGRGASVRSINPSDNRGSGACIGAQCRNLQDGTRVRVIVNDDGH